MSITNLMQAGPGKKGKKMMSKKMGRKSKKMGRK